MKHLLIILSILILSSPLNGDSKKKGNIYKWETDSGIQWRELGDKDIQAKYEGDVYNWNSHSLGLIRFSDGVKYSLLNLQN